MALTAPLVLQDVDYPASQLRGFVSAAGGIQRGVFGAGDFKVTQAGGGSTNVFIAAGYAAVDAPSGRHYLEYNNSPITSLNGGGNGNATNPRIDCVVLKINDKRDGGASVSGATISVRQGTPTAGATLDNRAGAPSVLPTSELLLADMLMPVNGNAYLTANIRDRRAWARGAYSQIVGNGAGPQSTSSTTYAAVPLHTSPRIEIGPGNLLEVNGVVQNSTVSGGGGRVRVVGIGSTAEYANLSTISQNGLSVTDVVAPAAGSWTPALQFVAAVSGNNFTVTNSVAYPTRIYLREIVGGQKDNS